jgi:hypothetical protein
LGGGGTAVDPASILASQQHAHQQQYSQDQHRFGSVDESSTGGGEFDPSSNMFDSSFGDDPVCFAFSPFRTFLFLRN